MSYQLFETPQEMITSDDYYTPEWIFDRLALRFDIDVAAPPGGVPWVPADHFYTQADNGLTAPWTGRVWMNPPYSAPTPWINRFIIHRHGVCLVPMAKSAWFFRLWAEAEGVAVHDRTVAFVGGQIFMPVCLAAFGDDCVEAIGRVGVVRRAVA